MASVFIAALAFILVVFVAATYPVHKEDQDLIKTIMHHEMAMGKDQHAAAEAIDLWNEETEKDQNKVEDGKDEEKDREVHKKREMKVKRKIKIEAGCKYRICTYSSDCCEENPYCYTMTYGLGYGRNSFCI